MQWEVIDGETVTSLEGTGSTTSFVVPEGPTRALRIRARVLLSTDEAATGGRAVLAGGREAVTEAIAQFRELQAEIGDPLTLTGARRDAYVRALYAMEKVERDSAIARRNPALANIANSVAMLLEAVELARRGQSPYEGLTGTFEAAYLSEADGTAQPFTLRIPDTFSPDSTYWLLIDLHGAGGTHEKGGEMVVRRLRLGVRADDHRRLAARTRPRIGL